MLFFWFLSHSWVTQSISAQSAVSMTNVRQSSGCFLTYITCSISIIQLLGASVRATSMSLVLPSVSINSGSGNREAKVLFPMPSGP